MRKTRWKRALGAMAVAALLAALPSCGYVLYPERRNAQPSQDMDTGVVVMDVLWLIPGLIPGVVALAVDFSSETAYYPANEASVAPGERVIVRAHGEVPTGSWITLRAVNGRGENLAPPAEAVLLDDGRMDGALALQVPEVREDEDARLELTVDGVVAARVPVWPLTDEEPPRDDKDKPGPPPHPDLYPATAAVVP